MRHSIGANTDHQASSEPSHPKLRVGSRLLADAYAGNGALLLRAGGIVASDFQLRRLARSDVRFGPNKSPYPTLDLEVEKVLDAEMRERELDTAEFRRRLHSAAVIKAEVVKDVVSVFSRIETTGSVERSDAERAVSSLVGEMLSDPRALVSLTQLKDIDAYTYTHSVNVSILAIYLAMGLGMTDDLEEIGIGALLHDIGKLSIPSPILEKKGELSPEEWKTMRQHPQTGVDILNKSGGYSELALTCVLEHHERAHGRGYPAGKNGSQIDQRSMIVALADVYDALTTERPYRGAMNPRDAMLMITQQLGIGFDQNLLKHFVSAVGFFPVGSTVKLSNGYSAVVIKNNPNDPLRPAVELVRDAQGDKVTCKKAIDLREKDGVYVKKFLKERSAIDIAREAAG